MAKQTDKRELFERTPVLRAITTMAIPTIISQLINLIYNTVDAIFIGRTGNPYMVASVSLAFTLFMMTISFGNLFGIGGGSLIARLIGRREEENARAVSAFSVFGAIAISLLYSLLIGVFLEPILNFLGASPETLGFAKDYTFYVVILGSVPVVLAMTLSHLLRNTGYATQASLGLSGGGILNIFLDWLLITKVFPTEKAVMAAALATLLSNVAACIYLLCMTTYLRKRATLSLNPRRIREVQKNDLKELFTVGVPSAILTALYDVGNIFLNRLAAAHGDFELAAMGIVMKAERLPNAVNIGLCQGMLPIVAFNYAAKNRERMHDVIRTARKLGLIVALVSVALIELLAAYIVRIFFNTTAGDAAAAAATLGFAVTFLRIRCLASPLQFLNYHSSFCMQAMGDGRDTLIHAVTRILLIYVPSMYLMDALLGVNGLAWATLVGEGLGALLATGLLRRWLRKTNESI
ncbi:MAG: cation transporter [Oscillospiraceae bacterium]|nr:cation transporter [Oscillospiraceae bacterium]